ncbi:MAG: hypothetical protein H6772_02625 [Pseudomonadales bacterium]|nr:hypothetical protein [Pseudomonadales bacterium]
MSDSFEDNSSKVSDSKKNNIRLYLTIVVFFLLIFGISYLFFQNILIRQKISNLELKLSDLHNSVLDFDKINDSSNSFIDNQNIESELKNMQDITSNDEWKSYKIFNEKLSFNYPPDWKLEENNVENSNSEWSMGDIQLLSPNNFLLRIRTNIDGLGGGCDEECQKNNIENQTLATLNFYNKPLYVVLNGLQPNKEFSSTGNIRFNVIPAQRCWNNICYGFDGLNTQGTTMITGEFVSKINGMESVYMMSDKFVNSTDVNTALKILETFSY